MTLNRYHHWRNQYEKRGMTCSIDSRQGMTYTTKRRMEAELWFKEFVTSFANRMPDVKRRELPSCMTICQVYEMYREAAKIPLGQTQFRRMWKEVFKDFVIPKVTNYVESIKNMSHNILGLLSLDNLSFNLFFLFFYLFQTNKFSKCGVCLLITEHIRCTQEKADKVSWTQRKQLHMDQQA